MAGQPDDISGSPLPCFLTNFALFYFVQCTVTNKYD